MCYKIIAHTLHCDVRPLVVMIDDISKPLINPYATPTACKCGNPDPKIQPRLRCDFGHNCCYMTVKMLCCRNKNCREVFRFHRYNRRNISEGALDQRGTATEDEGWAPLPVIDGDICDLGQAPPATAEFVQAREKLLNQAKGLYETLLHIKKTDAEIRQKSAHLFSTERDNHNSHSNCLYLKKFWEALCGYPTENDFQYNAEHDIKDLETSLVFLKSQSEDKYWDVVDSCIQLLELEDNGQGTITGLDAWE